MTRVQGHAGLSDLEVELRIVTPEGAAQTVSCSSGACGGRGTIDVKLDRVARRDDGRYVVAIGEGEIKSPVVLTTSMVRAVACMFMIEADAYHGTLAEDREPLTDLAGVLLGFGVLLANGSHIYMKGCGGVQVHSATRLPVDEITVALGLFCRLFDVPERTVKSRLLRKSPDAARAGEYALSPSRSWLARVLGVGARKRPATADEELADLERAMRSSGATRKQAPDAAKAKKLAELRALVDESLEG
jgi:hypothetical protein